MEEVESSKRIRNKTLYKIELYMIKVIPVLISSIYLIYTILSYFGIDLRILNYLGALSILPIIFLYLTSYVFGFCAYHRMFLHYIVINTLINVYDTYLGIPITDLEFLMLHLIVAGIFLFIILYLYLRRRRNDKAN